MSDLGRRKGFPALALVASALAIGWGLAAAPAEPASAASGPPTPFTQCPAIGASPSCEILLVVNSDNTVSVYKNSSVGPFDGSDDTLVGIVNDSASAVDAVTVSGPGSGLAGFDGDGICSGDYGTWDGSSGCPYGPTGYEGPGTSFMTEPSLPDSAEVDFTDGLAAGKSAYFSLEGALASAQLSAREGPLLDRYVALGDSFSSGEGNPPYIAGTDNASHPRSPVPADLCHRSSEAYGPLIQTKLDIPASDFTFAACSGAVMADFVDSLPGADAQYDEGPQLNAIAPAGQTSPSTSLVTMSVGGNDAGFPSILRACIGSGPASKSAQASCLNSITQHLDMGSRLLEQGGTILLSIQNNDYSFCNRSCASGFHFPGQQVVTVPSLADLYEQIHQRAPNAEILVLLYPHLFPATPPAQCVVGTLKIFGQTLVSADINAAEMKAANAAADSLDTVISGEITAAQAEGIDIQPVDSRTVFAGHEICTAQPWFNSIVGPLLSPDPGSFHPNATGQMQFANLFEAKI
jgi:hypothetical protein